MSHSPTRAVPSAGTAAPAGLPVALVIEDDRDVAYLLGVVLTQAGFSVVTAHDGLTGTRMAQEHEPVLTTIDIAMPELDGLETTRRIREFSDSYIVIISTRSDELDVLAGFGAGADDYVPKPIRPRELRARLTAVTRRPGHRLSVAPVPPVREGGSEQPHEAAAVQTDDQPDQPDSADPHGDEEGEAGKTGMVRLGMQFVGSWIEFRGLRLNPSRCLVVMDDRLIDMHAEHFRLLESMMYSGTRARSPRELALALRGEVESTATASREHDTAWVESLMISLLGRLEEHRRPVPRWIETLPNGKYRLVRPE